MRVEVDAGLEQNPQGDLSVEVLFEQRPESSKGVSHTSEWKPRTEKECGVVWKQQAAAGRWWRITEAS